MFDNSVNCAIYEFETGDLPFWVVVMIVNNHRQQSDKSGKEVEKFNSTELGSPSWLHVEVACRLEPKENIIAYALRVFLLFENVYPITSLD